MIDLLINAFSIALIFLTFYFVITGRGYEDQVERHAISFFMLGLLFTAFRIGAEIASANGVHTTLLSLRVAAILTVLTPICFIIGLKYIHDEQKEFEVNTENLKLQTKFIKNIVKK